MPHAFFRCPDPELPEEVEIEACLNHAQLLDRGCDFDALLLGVMVEDQDTRISPTRLANCPRQIALKRRYDYAVDPHQAWLKLRGTVFHKGFEALKEGASVVEEDLEMVVDGVTVQGRPDVLYPERGLVKDYKTTKRLPTSVRSSHQAQVSIYGRLASRHFGVEFTDGELLYVTMAATRRLRTKLWGEEETVAYIRSRLPSLLQAYDDAAPLPPPLKKSDEDAWMCKGCEVAEQCQRLAERGL